MNPNLKAPRIAPARWSPRGSSLFGNPGAVSFEHRCWTMNPISAGRIILWQQKDNRSYTREKSGINSDGILWKYYLWERDNREKLKEAICGLFSAGMQSFLKYRVYVMEETRNTLLQSCPFSPIAVLVRAMEERKLPRGGSVHYCFFNFCCCLLK